MSDLHMGGGKSGWCPCLQNLLSKPFHTEWAAFIILCSKTSYCSPAQEPSVTLSSPQDEVRTLSPGIQEGLKPGSDGEYL